MSVGNFRKLHPGMGQAVAERTILRKQADGQWETWGDVAQRVALGNSSLSPIREERKTEFALLNRHISNATLLMSGRHLQHGDADQSKRNLEIFSNCATASASFILFYLLLNGSGVGRCYDDDMMLVNWDHAPNLRCVLSHEHPDFDWSAHESVRDAKHKYGSGKDTLWFVVPDSREGWAKALELWENAAFEKIHKDKTLVLDFTKVRCKGSPIAGMQNRPASGPVPLMNAFAKAATLKNAGLEPWRQAMYLDHYFAECVLVGGARRSARMSTKYWKDRSVLDFITVKRPIEYAGLKLEEIIEYRAKSSPLGYLWSSNNSVVADEEFWTLLDLKRNDDEFQSEDAKHARQVMKMISQASYGDGTGEPGIINGHKLIQNDEGWDMLTTGEYVGSKKYQLNDDTETLMKRLAKRVKSKKNRMITNPCLTADTWIATDKGPRQIAELVDKPFRAMVDGISYMATGFWKTGTREVLKVTTDRGYEMRLTANHKVLVERARRPKLGGGYNFDHEWVEAGQLVPNDRIVLHNHKDAKWEGDGTFDEGWLVGEMVGDGGYNTDSYHGYVRFWGPNRAIMAERAAGFVHLLPKVSSPVPFRGVQTNIMNETMQVCCKALSNLADGLIEPRSKDILPRLEKMSSNFVAGFLRGLFDADGTVLHDSEKGRSVRLAQTNVNRLTTIQRMLSRLGIASTIYTNRKPDGFAILPDGNGGSKEYPTKAFHELSISRGSMTVFEQRVGFYDPDKSAKLSQALASITRGIYRESFLTDVVSVEPVGIEDVYDCTVDQVHCLDANGMVVHNCGEIALNLLGGYCVIADVVPYHAETLDEAEEAFRAGTRALIRVNLMDSLYDKEVKRTNRIGVGMTGVHEFAWKFFRIGFRDLINPDFDFQPNSLNERVTDARLLMQNNRNPRYRSAAFWLTLARFNRAVREESINYSKKLGVNTPHTMTTIKPAGTTSKLFGLTEGWHLPSMAWFMRWVQFRNDDPLVEKYRLAGYPTKTLTQYNNTVIVGFPTEPAIASLGMGDAMMTAAQATPEEQYKWLMLGEKYWIVGTDIDGVPVSTDTGNQISYTLKYDPKKVDYKQFREMLEKYQREIRCCSVMPQEDASAYEYLPEQAITKAQYEEIAHAIQQIMTEEIGREHIDCDKGGCPVDFVEGEKTEIAA